MRFLLPFLLGAMVACGSDGPSEGQQAGDCTDGADNDGDGLFDCADPGCGGAPACGGVRDAGAGADVGAGSDAGSADAGMSMGRFECCVNNTGYRCPNDAAFDRCFGFDLDGCIDACAFDDFECPQRCFDMAAMATPDPSQCTMDSSVTCMPVVDRCEPGPRCDLDSDCSSDNCTGGYCYGNAVGCRCDLDSDCRSDNCSGGMCYGNGVGDRCDLDSDCSSGNCSGGMCYGNGAGERCDLDSDCDSNNCSGGRCQ